MLPGLAEHGQEHDRPISSTPVRDPGATSRSRIRSSQTASLQVIRPRAAQFGAFLGEHAAYLVDPLEVAVAEAVQPVADLRFELEVGTGGPVSCRSRLIRLPGRQVDAPTRGIILAGLLGHMASSVHGTAAAMSARPDSTGSVGHAFRDSRSGWSGGPGVRFSGPPDHARFDAAGAGNGAPGHGHAAKRPAGETRGTVAARPHAGQRHHASPRPYLW